MLLPTDTVSKHRTIARTRSSNTKNQPLCRTLLPTTLSTTRDGPLTTSSPNHQRGDGNPCLYTPYETVFRDDWHRLRYHAREVVRVWTREPSHALRRIQLPKLNVSRLRRLSPRFAPNLGHLCIQKIASFTALWQIGNSLGICRSIDDPRFIPYTPAALQPHAAGSQAPPDWVLHSTPSRTPQEKTTCVGSSEPPSRSF